MTSGIFSASFTSSVIVSADHPGLTFSLRLIRSEPTYNQPVQQWSFVSDFAVSVSKTFLCCLLMTLRISNRKCLLSSSKVRDYSGTYTVKLVPCTTPPNLEYRLPVTCNPREPVIFDLDIRFQQVRVTELSEQNPLCSKSWFCLINTCVFTCGWLNSQILREKEVGQEGTKREKELYFVCFYF